MTISVISATPRAIAMMITVTIRIITMAGITIITIKNKRLKTSCNKGCENNNNDGNNESNEIKATDR